MGTAKKIIRDVVEVTAFTLVFCFLCSLVLLNTGEVIRIFVDRVLG